MWRGGDGEPARAGDGEPGPQDDSIIPAMETPDHTVPAVRATSAVRDVVPFACAMAAVAALSFLSGGYLIGRSTPVVIALLGAAAVWVWFLRRIARPSPVFLAALLVFGALTVWTGVSVLWSMGPDLSWIAFNLCAFYLAVLAVLGFTSAGALQLRTVAWGFLAVATAVGVYAFLGKALPAVVTHAHANARLDSPVGYWNVLGLMMILGLCVALALGGDRRTSMVLRVVAVAAAVPMCFTFYFTFSRGGWLVLVIALLLYFAFTTTRLASFATLVAVVAPVAFALWHLRFLATLFTATTSDAVRASEGSVLLRWAIMALVVAVGLQLVAALLQRHVAWPRQATIAAGAVVIVVVAVVVVGGATRFVQQRGGASWVEDRVNALVTDSDKTKGNGSARLGSLSTGRPGLWREAADQWRFVQVAGTGAGTFPFTHYRFRDGHYVVKHAHSQWLNVLSELGTIGLVLFVVAMVLVVAAAVGNPFSRRRDPLHPLLVALQTGIVVFVIHISWDWDWDMAAIGTVIFIFAAVCASYRRTRAAAASDASWAVRPAGAGKYPPDAEPQPRDAEPVPVRQPEAVASSVPVVNGAELASPVRAPRRLRWAAPAVASVTLVLLAVGWLPPYLALRAQNAALAASSDGDVPTALAAARRAATLDPLAVDPLLLEGRLLRQVGRNREALARLREAARLQPDNYKVWYDLGVLQHEVFNRDKAARASLSRALGLNPYDSSSREEFKLLSH